MKPKPFVRKRHGRWLIELPQFGFGRLNVGSIIGDFATQRKAFDFARAWAEKHGGGTATVTVASTPEPARYSRKGWRSVFR